MRTGVRKACQLGNDELTNKLVNASSMVESRVAARQGTNIGRLTRVTVAR